MAGLDASTDGRPFRGRTGERLYAAVVVLRWPGGEIVEESYAAARASFPYVPGLLSFREIPLLIEALGRLTARPDLLVCDGQGIAHPRRFGLASHLGVLFDVASLGIAKSLLCGDVADPSPRRGSRRPIRWMGETVGYALRTRDGVRPVFVSPGHRIGLTDAAALALRLDSGFRIPQPTRLADQRVKIFKGTHTG